MAHNSQGFLLCWYSVIRQPEPLLSKVNADDVIFCCLALFVQPGLQLISERDDQYNSSASIAKNPMLCVRLVNLSSFVLTSLVLSAIPDLRIQYGLLVSAYCLLSCQNYVRAVVSLAWFHLLTLCNLLPVHLSNLLFQVWIYLWCSSSITPGISKLCLYFKMINFPVSISWSPTKSAFSIIVVEVV